VIGRPVFQKLIAELEGLPSAKRPKQIAVTSFDRLSRDMTDTLVVARTLRSLKVDLYVRSVGVVKADTFAQRAALVGQSMGGEAENEARSNRIKASWERRKREGKPTSNKVPYGLQLGRVRGDPMHERDMPAEGASASWVRNAFDWYASGIGSHVIAERFKQGAPPHLVRTGKIDLDGKPEVQERVPRRRHGVGHTWEYNRILKLLRQRRYRGTAVKPELFDRVQEMLARKPRWRTDRKAEYPLSGAVKCAGCHRSFHGRSSTGIRRKELASGETVTYHGKRTRYYGCTVCNVNINAEQMEEWFRRDVGRLEASKELLRRWVESEPAGKDLAAIRREIATLEHATSPDVVETQRNRAWDLAMSSPLASADLDRQLARISGRMQAELQRLNELRARLAPVDGARRSIEQAKHLLSGFWKRYNAASYEQKRALMGALTAALGGVTATKEGLAWTQTGALAQRSEGIRKRQREPKAILRINSR
jgi:hypothetical protein